MKHLKEYFDYNEGMDQPHSREMENYMFFQNLHTMKREIEAILALDHSKVDAILHDGHGWALDHIATSVDDVLEVSNFLKNSVQLDQEESGDGVDPEETVLVTNIEDVEMEESKCSSCGGQMIEEYCPACK
jgi:hypothetical protein